MMAVVPPGHIDRGRGNTGTQRKIRHEKFLKLMVTNAKMLIYQAYHLLALNLALVLVKQDSL